jgi:hypothetical protein
MGTVSVADPSRAGVVYALAVFVVGFALGTIRVLLVAPRTGPTAAVLLEAPLMLCASWWVSRRCIRYFRVVPAPRARALMGTVAFVFLMLEEWALAAVVFRSSAVAYLSSFASSQGAIGLAAQLAFAFIPLIQGLRGCTRRSRSASSPGIDDHHPHW